jgi:CheY-like chemotaxis protein
MILAPAERACGIERRSRAGVREEKAHAMARILIAERDPVLAETWRAALERLGHVVTIKKSGLDALRSASREPPDLIVAELVMPGSGGLALAGRIKLAGADTKVIVTTGHPALLDPSVDGLAMARRAGADLTLAKPVQLSELIESVRRLLADPSESPDAAEFAIRASPAALPES